MWCSIHKWKISRSLDSGKPPGNLTRRHLDRCGSCREYARFAEDLGQRLSDEGAAVVASADSSLAKKVSTALERQMKSPAQPRPNPVRLKPALAAAASLTLIAVSLIWIVSSRTVKLPALDPLFEFARPQERLADAALKAESPLQKEMKEWEQAFSSAADYIRARLDVKLSE